MILVTGANGLLGSSVCAELVRNGKQVIALVRTSSEMRLLDDIKDQIIIWQNDILNPEELSDQIENISCIIHCAAIVSFHQKDKESMDQVNIQGTANMVNLAIRHHIPYFIHISSVAALGRVTGKDVVTENSTWVESNLNSNYAQSKYLAELEVWRGIEEGLKAVILNPSVIISSLDLNRSSGQLFNYVLNEYNFYPKGSINFVDVRDVVAIVCKCLDSQITGQRYILNGGMIPYKDFFSKIAGKLNVKAPHKKASKSLLTFGLITESIKSVFTGKRPLITKETVRLSGSEIYFSNEKAITELNYTFAPLDETLDWACSTIQQKV